MASISNDPGGLKRLIFVVDGHRRTLRLGRCPDDVAILVKQHVEHLVKAMEYGLQPVLTEPEWADRVSLRVKSKLAQWGLYRMPRGQRSERDLRQEMARLKRRCQQIRAELKVITTKNWQARRKAEQLALMSLSMKGSLNADAHDGTV